MNIPITNPSGKVVGFFKTEDLTYYRQVSKEHQFQSPKYSGMLAVSESILKKLASLGCKRFCFRLKEWEDKPFDVIISFSDFIDKKEPLFFKNKINSDRQFGVRLYFWTRRPLEQEVLR